MSTPVQSAYTAGYGSIIYFSPDNTTWTKVGQSKDIKGPTPEVGDIKITNNDSPANTKESAPGMIEPGEISFEVIYTPAGFAALYGIFGNGIIYFWKEVFADHSGFVAQGYLKKLPVETKTEDEANHIAVTVKLTSKPVHSATGLS